MAKRNRKPAAPTTRTKPEPPHPTLQAPEVNRRMELLDLVTADMSKASICKTEWSKIAGVNPDTAQRDINWLRSRLADITPQEVCKKTAASLGRAIAATMERIAAGEEMKNLPESAIARLIDSALALSQAAAPKPTEKDSDSSSMLRVIFPSGDK